MIHPVLRRYWPPEGQILLLKVALADADSAKSAWLDWAARNNIDDASWAEVRLLATAARRVLKFDPTSPSLRRLEGVRRFVWTTTQLNVIAAHPLLARLREANIRIMLIKGAARLALDHQSSTDRHLNDIDVLIHPHDWPRALQLANQEGWRCPLWPTLTPQIFPHHHAVMIQDNSGHNVDLHHLALFMCRNVGDDDGLWQRAKTATLRGITLHAPSPADEIMIAIAHGLLHAPSPIADWMLDIAPLIRSGEVDWTILESETYARNIVPNIASGLLLAVEHFKLPVPRATLERLILRVREPFITDFRSFATYHMPSDPWTVERVKAAAALRALSAAGRLNKHMQVPMAPSEKRSIGVRIRQMLLKTTCADSTSAAYIERGPSNNFVSLVTRTASRLMRLVPPPAEYSEVSPLGHPIQLAIPAILNSEAILTLSISLQVDNCYGPHRPVLEIAAPGLILKHWRAPGAGGFNRIIVQIPAALFTLRRIEYVELRSLIPSSAAQFKNVSLHWTVLNNPSATFPDLLKLFDPIWYQRKQSTTSIPDVELLWDYLEAGWLDGRNPSPQFDANAYLLRNHDVASARINPLLHYVQRGIREGRVAEPLLPEKTATQALPPIDEPFADQSRIVLESGYFDADFYRSEYPEVLGSDLDTMTEFVRGGWRGRRSPGPRFDTEWYLQKYPDVAAADMNPLIHYMRFGRVEGRRSLRLSSRLRAAIRAAYPKLIRLEPQLERFIALRDPDLLGDGDPFEVGPVPKSFGAFFNSLDRAYERIIFVPWISLGGADLVAMLVAKAAADAYGHDSVLIVITDSDQNNAAHWLPAGVQTRAISDFEPKLADEDRALFVACVVETIRPKAVMNINSRSCWNAFMTYGKSMANTSGLYAMLFGPDYDEHGRPIGYSDTHFRNCLPQLRRIYCDTEQFPCDLAETYGLTEKARLKLLSIRPPPEANMPAWVRSPKDARQTFSILWAGRWCREKNLELLLNICRSLPDMEFHVFGTGTDHYTRLLAKAEAELDNLSVEGQFASFDSLPLAQHDVFLYTSLGDGMPRVLIGAGASGMPVVAPDVGGIHELIDDQTGWLVRDRNDVHAFVSALRSVRAAPAEADRRRRQLMERVAEEHNWQNFCYRLGIEPGFLAN